MVEWEAKRGEWKAKKVEWEPTVEWKAKTVVWEAKRGEELKDSEGKTKKGEGKLKRGEWKAKKSKWKTKNGKELTERETKPSEGELNSSERAFWGNELTLPHETGRDTVTETRSSHRQIARGWCGDATSTQRPSTFQKKEERACRTGCRTQKKGEQYWCNDNWPLRP